jgi:uncharacterized protein (TIGR02996 family)
MPLRDSFLQCIAQHPGDDTPRLVYADWLEEQDNPADQARGEFIRCQIRADNPNDPERVQAAHRGAELLDLHRAEWEAPLRELGAEDVSFARGFPMGIRIPYRDFMAQADRIFAAAPVTSLDLASNALGPEGARALAAIPHLKRLTSLDLTHNDLSAAGATALAASPNLQNLTSLILLNNRLGPAGVTAIA